MLIVRIIVAMAVTYILSTLIPGIQVDSWEVALIFSIIFTLINVTVGRLVRFLGCFVQLITFGLFGLVINVILLRWAVDWVDGIHIDGWGSAIILSLSITFVSWLMIRDLSSSRK